MLYHKSSLNYWISIAFIRRIGLLIISVLKRLKLLRLKNHSILDKHLNNSSKLGILNYLKLSNFIHSNTDGPENPYSRVYKVNDMKKVFSYFQLEDSKCHFINERHFPGIKFLPNSIKKLLAKNFGWHLWGYFKNSKGYKK